MVYSSTIGIDQFIYLYVGEISCSSRIHETASKTAEKESPRTLKFYKKLYITTVINVVL